MALDFADLFDFGTGEEPDLASTTEGDGGGEYDVADASGNVPAASPAALASKIKQVAGNLGISPEDLATAISYETGGRFSSKMMGGAGNNYMGLIQFGPEERKQYGASSNQTPVEQMDAVERYLRDRGIKPGMGMLDLYSTINAGSPGRYNASDARNGGAPGSVRDKVEQQMGDHRVAAQKLLGNATADDGGGVEIRSPTPIPNVPIVGTSPVPAAAPVPYVVPAAFQTAELPTNDGDLPEDQSGTPAPQTPDLTGQVSPSAVISSPQKSIMDGAEAAKVLQGLLNSPVQDIKAEQETPGSVTNQDQGLTGELNQPAPPITAPVAPANKGLLADATIQPPEPLADGFISKLVKEAATQVAQGTRGVVDSAAALTNVPNAAGGLLSKSLAKAGVPGAQTAADYFSRNYAANQQIGKTLIPVDKPVGPGQVMMRTLGQAYVPGSPAMTVAGAGGSLLNDALTPQPAMSKELANRLLATPETQPQMFPYTGSLGPRVSHTAENPTFLTAGGPIQLGGNEWRYLGIMGLATVGAIFAPRVFKAIASTALPTFRDVPYAEPGTVTISNLGSLARTYDDQWGGLIRDLRRAGADPAVVKEVSDNLHIQTGSTPDRLINSAVSSGRMETPSFTFTSRVPLLDIAKVETPDLQNYLKARSTVRQILETDSAKAIPSTVVQLQRAAVAGPTTINGMTAVDAQSIVNAYDASNPALKQQATAYSDVQKNLNSFLTSGEYATHLKYKAGDPQRPQYLQSHVVNHPDFVPYLDTEGSTKIVEEPLPGAPSQVTSPVLALRRNMQDQMRDRMANEAKGMYVDAMNKQNPGFFVEVPKENWDKQSMAERKNTVSIYRRGEEYRYTTDPFYADVMKLDPYYITGTLPMSAYALKRGVEMTSTGILQPLFSLTSLIRNHQLAKLAVVDGRSSPNILNTIAAVPQQIGPLAVRVVRDRVDGATNGWLRKVLGDQVADSVYATAARTYSNSYFAQFEAAGTNRGTYTEQQAKVNNAFTKALDSLPIGAARNFVAGLHEINSALHNAPAYAYARKNVGKTQLPLLMKEARELTGDNTVGGRFLANNGGPIRFDMGKGIFPELGTAAVKTYGGLTEVGRTSVPWWNATVQGVKAVGDQYMKNPAKFVGRFWLYQAMPSAAVYMWNRGLGFDPNGQSYVDYHMNGRSEYDRQMNTYIGLPNRPVEEGVRIPRVQEFSLGNRMMEDALHHITYSQQFQNSEDFLRSALRFVGAKDPFPQGNGAPYFSDNQDWLDNFKGSAQAVFDPSTPPWITLPMAALGGKNMAGGLLSSDAYSVKENPYDSNKGMNENLEAVTRALGTGFADVIGAGYAAFHNTPEGYGTAIKNALSAAGKRQISKGPLLRDVLNLEPPATGNTRLTGMLFDEEKVINQLSKFYRAQDQKGGALSTKPMSASGEKVATELLGPMPSGQNPGLDQLPPTNPLYKEFMKQVYDTFNKDTEKTGGIGMKSLWKRYGMAQTVLKSLRSVNDGNNARWADTLKGDDKAEVVSELKSFNVPIDDIRSVRNFYMRRQQAAVKQLLFSIRAAKENMNANPNVILANGGKPVDWKDFDPYRGLASQMQPASPLDDTSISPPWE